MRPRPRSVSSSSTSPTTPPCGGWSSVDRAARPRRVQRRLRRRRGPRGGRRRDPGRAVRGERVRALADGPGVAARHAVRGHGAIVVIGSFGSRMPFPGIAAYRSSKAAVAAICGALHLEVAGFGIRVLHVQPGLVRSSFDAEHGRWPGSGSAGPVRGGVRRRGARLSAHVARGAVRGRRGRPRRGELRLDGGPLEVAIGEDAERMLAWVAEGQAAFEEHLERRPRLRRAPVASGPSMTGVPWTPGLELGCPACGWTGAAGGRAGAVRPLRRAAGDPLSAGRIVVPAHPGGGAHRPGALPLTAGGRPGSGTRPAQAGVAQPDRVAQGPLPRRRRRPSHVTPARPAW